MHQSLLKSSRSREFSESYFLEFFIRNISRNSFYVSPFSPILIITFFSTTRNLSRSNLYCSNIFSTSFPSILSKHQFTMSIPCESQVQPQKQQFKSVSSCNRNIRSFIILTTALFPPTLSSSVSYQYASRKLSIISIFGFDFFRVSKLYGLPFRGYQISFIYSIYSYFFSSSPLFLLRSLLQLLSLSTFALFFQFGNVMQLSLQLFPIIIARFKFYVFKNSQKIINLRFQNFIKRKFKPIQIYNKIIKYYKNKNKKYIIRKHKMESSIKVDQKRLENIVTLMNQLPQQFNRGCMDLILDSEHEDKGKLYLGCQPYSKKYEEEVKENKIQAVLSILESPTTLEVKSQIKIRLEDHPGEDINKHFEKAYEYIDGNLQTTNVFVHCLAGVSRSATIVISYLMKKFGWSVEEAIYEVQFHRSQIYPNKGFLEQLINYEVNVLKLKPPTTELKKEEQKQEEQKKDD